MNAPKVSIGLPVYNGEPFLSKTIDAILTQTFNDFELIICDNASTDATETICRKYAAQDKRINYYQNCLCDRYVRSVERQAIALI